MASIGTFGDAADVPEGQEPLTFSYFGLEVRVNQDFSPLSFVDFAEAASGLDGNVMAQLSSVKVMLRELVDPVDFVEFWRTAKRHRQSPEDLAGLMKTLTEAIADRPTERPSTSSGGRSSTGQTSEPAATSQPAAPFAGRPDLGVALEDLQRQKQLAGATA